MLRFLLLGLLATASAARAQTLAPTDTLPGHARLVRSLSTAMCEQLATQYRALDLSQLVPDSAQQLLVRLSYQALMTYPDEVERMVAASPTPDATGAGLVQAAHQQLAMQCPAARPLLARIGMQYAAQPTVVTSAERPLLSTVARSICQRLDAADAHQPFAKLTPGERVLAVNRATDAAMLAHRQQLTAFYQTDLSADPALRLKIGQLVLEQCPTYLLQVSRDVSAGRLPGPPLLNDAPSLDAPPLDQPTPAPPKRRPRKH